MQKLLIIGFILFAFEPYTQVVNGYAEVTGIAGNVLTLGTVDESADSFEDDEWIVIMQMQDDVIGNVSNTANFGDLGNIENAGIYELRQIQSHTEVAGAPTSITLASNPAFTYNICNNCAVQVITFRQFGNPDYSTNAAMSALDWNGTIGGVLAFYVDGVLTLNNSLNADFAGFRGAGPNAGGSAGCSGGGSYRVNNQANFADKGEGIFKSILPNQAAGMGKILNGGGGGNSHNGGGGGGGNYTSGGDAGPGWPNCTPSAGGMGGISLQSEITVGRIFLGGGGGAGEGNNNLSTDGGDGGGIILIKANEITTTGTCTGVSISSNGEGIAFAGNDGGGGGGAGGSIVLEVGAWSINSACPLTVEANGGDGGSVNSGATHGGGGGGGQGVVFYSSAEPTSNITTNTDRGNGGCDNNSNPCNSQAGNGGGTDGDGVQDLLTGPLPIELLVFTAELNNGIVDLNWETASEHNNDYFTVFHSVNGFEWKVIDKIDGAGNSTSYLSYHTEHTKPQLGVNYYKLRQTDFNGTYTQSNVVSVNFSEESTLIYPNPADNIVNIAKPGIGDYMVKLINPLGQEMSIDINVYDNMLQMNTSGLPVGIYLIVLSNSTQQEIIRFNVNH